VLDPQGDPPIVTHALQAFSEICIISMVKFMSE